jgi:hypothetical protein
VPIHWWLNFKASDDAFGEEVTDSSLDLVIGIIELILINYVVLMARSANYISAGWFITALMGVDLLWTTIWLYVGKWRTKDLEKIKLMEQELKNNLKLVLTELIGFVLLLILSFFVTPFVYVVGFMILYSIFIFLSYRYKIIDIRIF